MSTIKVSNQNELEAAVKKQVTDSSIEIELHGGYFEVDGSSQVTACDSSQVTAYGSSQVRAYDSSQVTAYGSSQVRACDSSQVTACDSSQVTACDSSQVTASKQVAVTIHGKYAKVTGGVQVAYRKPINTQEWLEEYALTPEDGVVILFKAVNDSYKSHYGTSYAPGTSPSAPDWDGGERECGGGLHFCALPVISLGFYREATKFIACPILVSEISVTPDAEYPNKIKAPRVYGACYEVDINGKPINVEVAAK